MNRSVALLRLLLAGLLTMTALVAAPLRAEATPGPTPSAVAFSKDGGTVVTGWSDGVVTAHATATATASRELWHAPERSGIQNIAFSADGTRLLVASYRALEVIDWPSGRVVRRYALRDDSYEEAQISPDGRYVVMPMVSAEQTVVLNIATGAVQRLIGGDPGGRGLEFSKSNPAFSGDLILTYGTDPDEPLAETIFVWSRAGTLKFKAEICCGNRVAELVPGRRLLIGGSKKTTSILDLLTGTKTDLPGKWPND